MSQAELLTQAHPVKLVMGLIYREKTVLQQGLKVLTADFGDIDYHSSSIPFSKSNYYKTEMGAELWRCFISFKELQDPTSLVEIKLRTHQIEQDFAIDTNRCLNIDPGYLDLVKFVLASFKGQHHKIYFGKGVWIDWTLYFAKGSYHAFPWTFPGFRDGIFHEDLCSIRGQYKLNLNIMRDSS